jgi:hypothetical protein
VHIAITNCKQKENNDEKTSKNETPKGTKTNKDRPEVLKKCQKRKHKATIRNEKQQRST